MPKSLSAQLELLPSLSRADLLNQFERVYRRAPPLRLSNSILALAVAYRLQEQKLGGLNPEVRRALLSDKPLAVPSRVSAGTILIREWHGREYTVTVHSDHVEFIGERFRSLTQVVFRITGQRRSGPLFFGLRKSTL